MEQKAYLKMHTPIKPKEKPSVLGQIKKYQSEDKAKPKEKKETNKKAER